MFSIPSSREHRKQDIVGFPHLHSIGEPEARDQARSLRDECVARIKKRPQRRASLSSCSLTRETSGEYIATPEALERSQRFPSAALCMSTEELEAVVGLFHQS